VGATIKDVAKKVGVTPTTVSMVLRGDSRISDGTKEKVLKAAKELNYYPNSIGRSLVKGKTNTIAIASHLFYGPFKTDILNGIDNELKETKYRTFNFPFKSGQEEEGFREMLFGRICDGVIAINMAMNKEVAALYREEKRPIVFVEDVVEGLAGVKGDGFQGSYDAVMHLIKSGRKKIGLVVGAYGEMVNVKERLGGYKKALKDSGLEFDKDMVMESRFYNFPEGKDICKEMLEAKPGIDAVFVGAGDLVAMGMMRHAKDTGVKIPDDIAIIGYDGLDSGSLSSPELTTVKQPVFEMGTRAFKMIMDMIENPEKKYEIEVFKPELLVRGSA